MTSQKKLTNWRKRFANAKSPHMVTLHADFAGVKAGMRMLISSPEDIAKFIASIPKGETRTIARLRSDLAKRANSDAMCPVTTAIFLKVVAELSLSELASGKSIDDVVPFWRIIDPSSKLAAKLSCGREGLEHLLRLDGYQVSDSL